MPFCPCNIKLFQKRTFYLRSTLIKGMFSISASLWATESCLISRYQSDISLWLISDVNPAFGFCVPLALQFYQCYDKHTNHKWSPSITFYSLLHEFRTVVIFATCSMLHCLHCVSSACLFHWWKSLHNLLMFCPFVFVILSCSACSATVKFID